MGRVRLGGKGLEVGLGILEEWVKFCLLVMIDRRERNEKGWG
jgi:hypothetical protein